MGGSGGGTGVRQSVSRAYFSDTSNKASASQNSTYGERVTGKEPASAQQCGRGLSRNGRSTHVGSAHVDSVYAQHGHCTPKDAQWPVGRS